MDSFNDVLTQWQPFFSAIAGASATLAGLLFVSLSINRERITAQENRLLLRLAQRSFGDFLYALFIGLMFLIPRPGPHGMAISLFVLVAFRVRGLIRSIYRSATSRPDHPQIFGAVREYSFQTLSCLGLLAAGVEIYQGKTLAALFLVPVVALLLYNASLNAWLLLIMEKSGDVRR